MPDLIPFNFNSHTVRVINEDGEPWFIAKDVADSLGYSDTNQMTKKLDADEKSHRQIAGVGPKHGGSGVTLINEAGLYSCILSSQKPEAHRFKRWITHEVLPSLRRHGHYQSHGNPDLQLAQQVGSLRDSNQQLKDELIDTQRRLIQQLSQQTQPRRRNFSETEKQDMLRLRKQGMSHKQIGDWLGRSDSSVSSFLRRQGGDV